MTKNFLWLLLSLMVSLSHAQGSAKRKEVDGVAAVVGDQIVLNSDVQQLRYQLRSSGVSKDTSVCDALGNLMMKKLLIDRAKADTTIKVPEARITRAARMRLEAIVKQSGAPEQQILDFYNKTKSELIATISQVIREQQLTQEQTQKVLKGVDVSPQEVKDYYDAIPKATLPEVDEEAELSRIVKYPIISEASRQKVIDQLKAIRRDVQQQGPDSFRTKAIIYSEDPASASNGGEYKNVKRGQFVKEFEAVAFNMAEGTISEPFQTQFGFHIIQLLKRHGEQLDLRHILIKVKPTPEEMQHTIRYLDSIKGLIEQGSMSFEEAARRFSDDKDTRFNGGRITDPKTGLNRFSFSDMQPDMYLAVKDLQKAAIAAPSQGQFDGRKACFLYKMDERFPPHKLSYASDFQRLRKETLAKKKEKKLLDWRDANIPDTFIEVSKPYQHCQRLKPWLGK